MLSVFGEPNMTDAIALLQQRVKETMETPAIVLGQDAPRDAYTADMAADLFRRQKRNALNPFIGGLRDAMKAIPKTEPVERMTALSTYHLGKLWRETNAAIETAVRKHGAQEVGNTVQEALDICKTDNLSLTHKTSWEGSSYASDDSAQQIRKCRKLLAPYRIMDSEGELAGEDKLVYMSTVKKEDHEPLLKNGFVIKNIPADLLERSFPSLYIQLPNGIAWNPTFGGKHFETAWALSTILDTLEHGGEVKNNAFDILEEIVVPGEVNLVGHYVIEDGKEERIAPPRAEKQPRTERRGIAPDDPHLKKRGRGKGRGGETQDE